MGILNLRKLGRTETVACRNPLSRAQHSLQTSSGKSNQAVVYVMNRQHIYTATGDFSNILKFRRYVHYPECRSDWLPTTINWLPQLVMAKKATICIRVYRSTLTTVKEIKSATHFLSHCKSLKLPPRMWEECLLVMPGQVYGQNAVAPRCRMKELYH